MPPDERDGENPFERWDLDPPRRAAAITERMREHVEDATDDDEEGDPRRVGGELTLHPARRVRAALGAHPDSHGREARLPGAPPGRRLLGPPALEDLALRPSVLEALGASEEPSLPDVPFDRDPILAG
ncbi:MAG: hypothetical protein M5U28_03660 [Sandaracinaceae bacterium]|nr:hypothetical protein [Sandaracinaceae bacterium]